MVALYKGNRIPIRLVSSNPTGYVLRVDFYVEHRDGSNRAPTLASVAGKPVPTRTYQLHC
jgi:hypothetical protein